MRIMFGIFLIVTGIIVGVYVGFWLLLVGGVVQIIQQFNIPVAQSSEIAIGLLKIMFAGISGFLCSVILITPGFLLLFDE